MDIFKLIIFLQCVLCVPWLGLKVPSMWRGVALIKVMGNFKVCFKIFRSHKKEFKVMEIFRNRSQQRNFNKSAANISSRSKREVFFGQILYSIHCVFAVVWIKITLREANTYLTVRTVAMTTMGRRRMESRMGKRTTEGEAGEGFLSPSGDLVPSVVWDIRPNI